MRRLLLILLVLILPSTAGAYYYVSYYILPMRIEKEILLSLHELGFKKIDYKNIERKKSKITLHKVSLDDKSFSGMESLTVRFSLLNYLLNNYKAKSIEVKKLLLSGELKDNYALNIVGWDNDFKFIKKIANIPAQKIVFQESSLDILVPQIGGLVIQYQGEISKNDNEEIEIAGTVKTAQKKFEAETTLTGTINQNGGLEVQTHSDKIKIETDDLVVRRASYNANFLVFSDHISSFTGEMNAGSVIWKNLPFQDVNFAFEKKDEIIKTYIEGKTSGEQKTEFFVQSSTDKDKSSFEISLQPETIGGLISYLKNNRYIQDNLVLPEMLINERNPALKIEGIYESSKVLSGMFRFEFTDSKYEVVGDFKQNIDENILEGNFYIPRSFIHLKKNLEGAQFISGNLILSAEGLFDYNYRLGDFNWNLKCKIDDSSLEIGSIKIQNIQGRLVKDNVRQNINSIENLNQQTLSFKAPIYLSEGHLGNINLSLFDFPIPLVKSFKLPLFQGLIETGPIEFNSELVPKDFVLEIGDINLSNLGQDLKFPELYLTGKAGGKIPLSVKENRFHITKGLIQSQQNGLIQIPDSILNFYFPAQDSKSEHIRKALRNFQYEFFEMRLNGPLDGPIMINVLTRGMNVLDATLEGKIDLNFSIEAKLSDVFKNIIISEKPP